jgi:predicted transcriptional regulator
MTTNPDELHENGAQHYPETLRITIGGANEAVDHAIEQVDASGVPDEAIRSFERVADIRTLLTDRRLDVMRTIMTDGPESIQALADALGRNYADVHGDVQVLAEHHIVYFDTDGRAKRPVIPYDSVRVDIEVTGGSSGERAPV